MGWRKIKWDNEKKIFKKVVNFEWKRVEGEY